MLGVQKVPHKKVSSDGIVAARGTGNPRTFAVADMVEILPVDESPSNMAVLGRYVITPEIFELLEHTDLGAGGEIQLTDGLRFLLKISWSMPIILKDAGMMWATNKVFWKRPWSLPCAVQICMTDF